MKRWGVLVVLVDAPPFDSGDQLLERAGDREVWRKAVHALLPVADPSYPSKNRKIGKEKKEDAISNTGFVFGKDGKLVQAI